MESEIQKERKKDRKTKKKMRGRGRIWGVNERKGGYVDGGKKKEKKEGNGNRGRERKKIEKKKYFGSCEKNIIY